MIRVAPVPRPENAERRAIVGRAVVEAVAYADVFDWPLTAPEIHRFLVEPALLAEVDEALRWSRLDEFVSQTAGLVTLTGREHLPLERRAREVRSAALWPHAVRYASLIGALPFVRMVAVTGSLAASAVTEKADIDLFVVTLDGRLWLTRALTIAVVRVAKCRRLELCPNYFLAESALELKDRDLFTAHEFVQMVPVSGVRAYQGLLERNGWYRDFLPNHPGPAAPPRSSSDNRVRRSAERALSSRPLDHLERWEMRRKIARLGAVLPSAPPSAGEEPEAFYHAAACKGHVDGYRTRTLAAFGDRLALLDGLARLEGQIA